MSRPFVPLADGAQAEILFLLGSGIVECRLWFVRRSGVVSAVTLQELADGLFLLYTANVMPLLSDQIVCVLVRATDWTVSGGISEITFFSGVNGGLNSGVHSANVAARLMFISAQLPPSIRNYNFVPGIDKSVVSLNTFDATWANDLRLAYALIPDAAPTWGTFPAWQWVCTSQEEAGSPRTTQLAARTDFTRVKSTVSQRRKRLLYT